MALPIVTTSGITSITTTTASGGGYISGTTGITVTARGIVWSLNPNPTTGDTRTANGQGLSGFTSSLTDLQPNNLYYVRAYARTVSGITYGAQVSFSTALAVEMSQEDYRLWARIGYVEDVTPTDASVAIQLDYLIDESIANEQP